MIILITLLIIIGNFILQSTVLHYFSIFNVLANTGLIIVVIIGLLRGEKFGGSVGLVLGLLQDIIYNSVIGINGFIYFFIGYFVGLLEDRLTRDNVLIPIIFTGLATILYHLFYYLFMYFSSYNIPILTFFKNTVIIEMVLNSAISIVVYKKFSKIFVIPSIRFGRR